LTRTAGAAFIDEVMAFPYEQSPADPQRSLDAFLGEDTTGRLPQITAPTVVLAGGIDSIARPELGRVVARAIPGARFEVLDEEALRPSRRCRTGGTLGSTGSGRRSRRY
jgi:pimeloyl-ACP methyl ester carboxylesterase